MSRADKITIEYVPYTYLIGWSKLNKWYYGSEFGNKVKIANPNNLWTKYFTSSNVVKQMIKQHGNPDVIQIRKTFKTKKETQLWENKVLVKLDVINSTKWLNQHDASHLMIGHNKPHSAAAKLKISKAAKGREPWNKGKSWPDEILIKMRKPRTIKMPPKTENFIKSLSDRMKGNTFWLGKKHSNETKNKIAIARKKYWKQKKEQNNVASR